MRPTKDNSKGPVNVKPVGIPSKKRVRAFYKRHPKVQPRRLKTLDLERHDTNIYDKAAEWFDIIDKELHAPNILQENVYNMDETGVMLSAPHSLHVLTLPELSELRSYRYRWINLLIPAVASAKPALASTSAANCSYRVELSVGMCFNPLRDRKLAVPYGEDLA